MAPKAFELPKQPPQPPGEQCLSYLESQGGRAVDFEESLVAGDSAEALKTWHNSTENWLRHQSTNNQCRIGPRSKDELGRGSMPKFRWGTATAQVGPIALGQASHAMQKEDKALRRLYRIRKIPLTGYRKFKGLSFEHT